MEEPTTYTFSFASDDAALCGEVFGLLAMEGHKVHMVNHSGDWQAEWSEHAAASDRVVQFLSAAYETNPYTNIESGFLYMLFSSQLKVVTVDLRGRPPRAPAELVREIRAAAPAKLALGGAVV